jgi:Septum formation
VTRVRRARPGPVAGLLPALVASLLLGGCSGDAPGGAPSPSAAPTSSTPSSPTGTSPSTAATPSPATAVPAAPPRGGCYRLAPAQLTRPTNASKPVPCRSRHTTQTISVGLLDTVVDGHAVAVDSRTVQRQLSTTCPQRLAAFLGGDLTARRLSRFNVVWFSPTLAQSDRGADWFRCDVIAFARQDELAPLPPPGRLRGVLDRDGALATYGLCGTSAPGDAGFERVLCGRRHSWRAVDTIDLAGGSRYPGTSAVRRAGDDDCKDLAQRRAGDSLRFRYGWEWPTQEQWQRGQRFGYCWVPG